MQLSSLMFPAFQIGDSLEIYVVYAARCLPGKWLQFLDEFFFKECENCPAIQYFSRKYVALKRSS
jgi:hypothetical protein